MRGHCLKKILFFYGILISFSLHGEPEYTLCIDGSGSKTVLQVIDKEGQVLSLVKNGLHLQQIETASSNINVIGIEGVRAVFKELFERVKVGEKEQSFSDLASKCQVVAGMAGIALVENKEKVIALFEEWGINRNCIQLMTDAEVTLQLVGNPGIILISGTGSICLGKQDLTIFRIGGLGRIVGDEGSGYQIGVQALKNALEEEYGWGNRTSLTPLLKKHFEVAELKNLIPHITKGEILPAKIAGAASLVFQEAFAQDEVAEKIIERAANDLQQLLLKMLRISQLSNCEIGLWGEVFQGPYADAFIEKIMSHPLFKQKNLKIVNRSHQNAPLLFATTVLPFRKEISPREGAKSKLFFVEPEKSVVVLP